MNCFDGFVQKLAVFRSVALLKFVEQVGESFFEFFAWNIS